MLYIYVHTFFFSIKQEMHLTENVVIYKKKYAFAGGLHTVKNTLI